MAWPSLALSQREVRLTEPAISLMRYCTMTLHLKLNFITLHLLAVSGEVHMQTCFYTEVIMKEFLM